MKKGVVIAALLVFLGVSFSYSKYSEAAQNKLDDLVNRYLGEGNRKIDDPWEVAKANSLPSYVEDIAQAVGQVIVDKATTEAFHMIKKQIQSEIGCNKNDSIFNFPAICRVLDSMRIEEIVSSKNVLFRAFMQDGLDYFFNKEVSGTNSKDEEFDLIKRIVSEILFERITNIDRPIETTVIPILMHDLTRYYCNRYQDDINGKYKVLASAALAVWQARIENPRYVNDLVLQESINQLVKGSDEKRDALRFALSINALLQDNLKTKDKVREKLADCIGLIFDTVFYVKGIENLHRNQVERKKAWFILARDFIEAAINKDINMLITTINVVLKDDSKSQKAMGYVGALLLYAQTYTDKNLREDDLAQKERTRIIRSLVMDRRVKTTGTVLSFGGSVRGVLADISKKPVSGETLFKKYGPFSVPIGIAAAVYIEKKFGFHFDLNMLDLGQFTTFVDGQGEVKKPVLTDAFAPSVTAGFFYGSAYPLYAGITYGYNPKHFKGATVDADKRPFSWALVLGLHVPLWDF